MFDSTKKIPATILSIVISSTLCSPCAAATATDDNTRLKSSVTSDNIDPIDSLAKQILLDEIKLAKFNLHFRLEATKQGRFKGLRYFLFQEANTALTEAGLICGVSERMSHIQGDGYKHLNRGVLMHGNVLSGIGQILGGSGSMLEFTINGYHSYLAWRKGYSPTQSKKYALSVLKDIDKNLNSMSTLAEQESASLSKVHNLERQVLVDIRDLLVNEFDSFHSSAKRSLWTQQSFYLLDTAKNVTGALGSLYGYKALRRQHRQFNQPASILTTISGGMIMVNPIASRLIGKSASVLDTYLLAKSGLPKKVNILANLQTDYQRLETACNDYKNNSEEEKVLTSVDRLDLYESHMNRFTTQYNIAANEIKKGNRVAVQNVLSGLFIGGTKVANGVEFIVAGYKYYNDPRMTNVMLGTGAIPYLAGSAYGLIDNLRIQVMREVDTYRLKKKHSLPGQLIHAQLDQLDALEKTVQAL